MSEKRKLNTFDVVFILIIIVAAIALFFYLRGRGNSGETELGDTVTYVMEIVSAESEIGEAISVGDNIVDAATKISLGTIKDLEFKEVENLTLDYEKGEYVLTDIPDKISARLTVEADITESASDILVEGQTSLKVSNSFAILGPGYVTYASVVYIERGAVE